MTWENLLKISFGSNEGYNKLMWAAEIIKDLRLAVEEPELIEQSHGLLTTTILQKIEDDKEKFERFIDSGIIDQLEVLADLFRWD